MSQMNQGWGAAAAWTHAEGRLTRGGGKNQAIAAGASYTTDLLVGGEDTLSVNVDMTGTAATDLTVVVQPYEADGVTLMPIALAPVRATGPTLSGGRIYYTAEYDVVPYAKVRAIITNSNAAAQTINSAGWSFGQVG